MMAERFHLQPDFTTDHSRREKERMMIGNNRQTMQKELKKGLEVLTTRDSRRRVDSVKINDQAGGRDT